MQRNAILNTLNNNIRKGQAYGTNDYGSKFDDKNYY